MKPRHRWLALVLTVAALGAGGLYFRPAAKAAAHDAPRAVLTVSAATPTRVSWPTTITASGTVAAWQEAVIGAQTGGLRVAAIHAEVGDHVRAGQLLAELASDAAQAELRRLTASLASARASLVQAQSNAERAKIAKQGNAISDQQYNDYLIAEQTAQANVDVAIAQLDDQHIGLGHTRIVAVDDGIVTSRSATLGKVVQIGDELFRMIRKGRLEWQAEVDAAQLAAVRPGQSVQVTLPTGGSVAGRVRIVAPSLSTGTGRGIVYVSIADSGAQAGMFANGHIEVGAAAALTVPQSAVTMADGYSYVFELGADNRALRRAVKTGRRQGDRVEIVAGLDDGVRIASAGGAFLADGDRVSVSSAEAEP